MKTKVRNALLSALVISGTVLAGSGAAQADSPNAERATIALPAGVTEEGRAYIDSLSPADRAEFVNTQLVSEFVYEEGAQTPTDAQARASLSEAEATDTVVSPMASGCWQARYNYGGKAPAGNTIYTAFHIGGWCSNGNAITSAYTVSYGGETSTPGWRYDGRINGSAGIVSNQGRSYSQFKFVLGVGGWDVQTPTPCIRVIGYTNGGDSGDLNCTIY